MDHPIKRSFDVLVAGGLIVFLSPLLLVVAALVRLNLGSPVLFRQTRPGLDGRPFTLYKFRTMERMIGPEGDRRPDGERLTPLGRLLRRSSLDELPELFNVLRGEMSLVGPRPLLMDYLPLYTVRQSRRHEVLPGITGWAQVNGRNTVQWEERLEMDVWYVDHRSFVLDFRILLRTLRTVVLREDISHPGSDTMPRFRGTASSHKEELHD